LEKAAAANQINEEPTTPNQLNEEPTAPNQINEEATTPNQTNEATPVILMNEATTPNQINEEPTTPNQTTPVNQMIEEAQAAISNEPPISPPLHDTENQKPKLKIKKRPTKLQVVTENAPDIAGDAKPVSKKESMIRLINRRQNSHHINVTKKPSTAELPPSVEANATDVEAPGERSTTPNFQ
jgi:hypothetical protein